MPRLHGSVRRSLFLAGAVMALALLPAGGGAQIILDLQAEDLVAFHAMDSDSFQIRECNGAEDSLAVDGLNLPGEWLELSFSLDATFCFRSTLLSQRLADHHCLWALLYSLEGAEVPVWTDTLYTIVGEGIGCSAPYNWTESEKVGCLEPGNYRLRLELQNKGMTRVDAVHLTEGETPIRPATWGRIKSVYRTD